MSLVLGMPLRFGVVRPQVARTCVQASQRDGGRREQLAGSPAQKVNAAGGPRYLVCFATERTLSENVTAKGSKVELFDVQER